MNKTKKCTGKESLLRMNYLYQLSNVGLKNKQLVASNLYASLILAISKKSVQQLDPQIKRTICKSCNQYLVPGVTCRVRIKKKHVNYTCLVCSLQKSYKATENYQLWSENSESTVEILDYNEDRSAEVKTEIVDSNENKYREFKNVDEKRIEIVDCSESKCADVTKTIDEKTLEMVHYNKDKSVEIETVAETTDGEIVGFIEKDTCGKVKTVDEQMEI